MNDVMTNEFWAECLPFDRPAAAFNDTTAKGLLMFFVLYDLEPESVDDLCGCYT
jgi:hypothetical protein